MTDLTTGRVSANDRRASATERWADAYSQSTTLLHPWLIAPGAALFVTAFVSDLLYWRTFSVAWATFSVWLITAGLVLAALAGLALLGDILLRRLDGVDWTRFAALAVAALLSLVNAFIHSRDAYAVMPEGLILSAIVTALIVFVAWRGWSLEAVRHAPYTRERLP